MNCYITLDYELFLGDNSGTPENCLITPMHHFSQILSDKNIKVTFFVDAAYLVQLSKLKEKYQKLKRDYDLVIDHIKMLESEGHSIQLHLHPQWCYSFFDGIKWVMDKDHYKLSDLPFGEQVELIHNGVELLNNILSKKVTAYRAGGYSIENFSELYDVFVSNGVLVDSSVLRGDVRKSRYHDYDYRDIPNLTSYRILKAINQINKEGQITEYPISTKTILPFLSICRVLTDRRVRRMTRNEKKWGDGNSISTGKATFFERVGKNVRRSIESASIDRSWFLEDIYNYSKSHIEGDDFVIIGHPKNFTPYSLKAFNDFINNHPELQYRVF